MNKIFGMDSLYPTSSDGPRFKAGTSSDEGLELLIPDVTLHKTASHRIVLNAKGEIEVVSAMGEIQNLGKEIR